ncbi:MAG: hypothetical protein CMF39_03310 [Legionellaceae bacterium]|nr:hypothetical protein [Legionellaceae bacterium]
MPHNKTEEKLQQENLRLAARLNQLNITQSTLRLTLAELVIAKDSAADAEQRYDTLKATFDKLKGMLTGDPSAIALSLQFAGFTTEGDAQLTLQTGRKERQLLTVTGASGDAWIWPDEEDGAPDPDASESSKLEATCRQQLRCIEKIKMKNAALTKRIEELKQNQDRYIQVATEKRAAYHQLEAEYTALVTKLLGAVRFSGDALKAIKTELSGKEAPTPPSSRGSFWNRFFASSAPHGTGASASAPKPQ